MAKILYFYELNAWKESHALTLRIYTITKTFPRDEIFGITSQLRRAASSVGANIAEGFGRFHFKDKNRFYFNARGSIAEVQNFLFLCRDEQLISSEIFKELFDRASSVYRLVNGLITSTRIAIDPISDEPITEEDFSSDDEETLITD